MIKGPANSFKAGISNYFWGFWGDISISLVYQGFQLFLLWGVVGEGLGILGRDLGRLADECA